MTNENLIECILYPIVMAGIFITLKLLNLINIPWWLALLPIILEILVLLIMAIVEAIKIIIERA